VLPANFLWKLERHLCLPFEIMAIDSATYFPNPEPPSPLRDRAVAINEQLLISVVRQHELIEIAEKLNEQLAQELAEDRRRRECDLSERHEEEKKRIELSQALARRVQELQEQASQLRNLAAEIGRIEQRERKRLAALLHDDLQQLLVAARMQLGNASSLLKDEGARGAVELASRWIEEATKASRHLTRQLRPPALYEEVLFAALHGLVSEMAERHQLKVEIHGQEAARPLGEDLKALLFDSIRELLFNVAKHAEVNEASVKMQEDDNALRILVEDHGKGFSLVDTASPNTCQGYGMFSLRDRLQAYGGSVAVVSSPGQGTQVTLQVPLPDSSRTL
jgi:signal transduction histidine kinase